MVGTPEDRTPVTTDLRFFRVELWGDRILMLQRTEEAFSSSAALREELARLRRAKNEDVAAGRRLLIDSRLAPLRTDFELSDAFADLRAEILRGHERVAIWVGSKVGLLQATRLVSADGRAQPTAVFDDEASALAYLLSD